MSCCPGGMLQRIDRAWEASDWPPYRSLAFNLEFDGRHSSRTNLASTDRLSLMSNTRYLLELIWRRAV